MSLWTPSEIRWLYLDLNSYFASVEQQVQPELRGRPVAVVPLETDATCAIAASYEAKAYGVKTGTRIYEAKRLCPGLVCVPARHALYVDFHHRILDEIDRHIPVTEVASIDEVACELDINQRAGEVAIRLANAIKSGIHQNVGEAIHCSIGIATNRYLAKLGTEVEKPKGLVVISPEDIPERFIHLGLRDLPGIGRSMELRLARAGISTLAQLWELSPKHLRALWHSVEGERMWYRLRGVEVEREQGERRTVGHSHVLAPENRPQEQARIVSQRLMHKAASRLRRLDYYAQAMQVSIRLENRMKFRAEAKFRHARDTQSLQPVWDACWEEIIAGARRHLPMRPASMQQLDKQGSRILKVSVSLHGLVPASEIQMDLFEQAPDIARQKRNEALSQLLDSLNQKYGRNTVTTATCLHDHDRTTGTKIAFTRIPDAEDFDA